MQLELQKNDVVFGCFRDHKSFIIMFSFEVKSDDVLGQLVSRGLLHFLIFEFYINNKLFYIRFFLKCQVIVVISLTTFKIQNDSVRPNK